MCTARAGLSVRGVGRSPGGLFAWDCGKNEAGAEGERRQSRFARAPDRRQSAARVVCKLKECGPLGAASIPDELSPWLPHMVSVVVPAVNGPGVRGPPMLPPTRVGWHRYKVRQHCEGSEKYGKTLDIEVMASPHCLLDRR